MLKKIFLIAFMLGFASLSFAQQAETTLTVAPNHPDDWGYMGAMVQVGNQEAQSVGNGITLSAKINDKVLLAVYAMNAKPVLSDSCKNIQIQQEGAHQLLFELKAWEIVCQYQ